MNTLPEPRLLKGRSTQPRHRPIVLLAGLIACLLTPTRARAELGLNITKVRSNGVATANGTTDLAALRFVLSATPVEVIVPSTAAVQLGGSHTTSIDVFTGITGPSSFGTGGSTTSTTTSGDFFGVDGNACALEVAAPYPSEAPISRSATWDASTFSTLGLNPGTYNYTWG
jgi:hypothetical protein